jgi:metal transporter CNNM
MMVHGAIDMRHAIVSEHMIPIDKVFKVSTDIILNKKTCWEIMTKGFSRIPVFKGQNESNFLGILLVKRLICLSTYELPLHESGIGLRTPIVCHPNTLILELLSLFREGRSHMAFVTE